MAREIGIDLGTSSVLICNKAQKIVLEEPSVVAYDSETGQIKKIGREAEAMIGRTPPHIATVRPLKDGVISHYDMTLCLLQWALRRAMGSVAYRPRMVICVPGGITEVEERALVDAATQAGASRTYLIEEPVAAAMGAGIDINAPKGTMVVDIGGGTTDIAVMSMGGVVASDSVKCGGDKFDEAIIRYMRRRHNLFIGDRTAEDVKFRIGNVFPGTGGNAGNKEQRTEKTEEASAEGTQPQEKAVPEKPEERTMEVRGRCLVEGLPKMITVTERDIFEAMEETTQQILDAVCRVVEKIPTELLSDIAESGIVLTGGGALLTGMDRRIAKAAGIPCRLAEDPLHCVAKGTGMVLGHLSMLQEGAVGIGGSSGRKR